MKSRSAFSNKAMFVVNEIHAGYSARTDLKWDSASGEPLADSEQFSGGGLPTARGYRESEALGGSALFGSIELRTPSLSNLLGQKAVNEWRFCIFGDAGIVFF